MPCCWRMSPAMTNSGGCRVCASDGFRWSRSTFPRPDPMIKNLLLLSLSLGGIHVCAAEPVNTVALNMLTTAEHPRNSEGAFVTLKSGRILFLYSQFSEGASDFSPCRVAQIFSDDQGRSWSEPRALFTPEPNTLEMSVSLLRLASGKIALFT